MDSIDGRIALLREIVSCAHNLYFSEYDADDFTPIYNNAPHESAVYFLLSMDIINESLVNPNESLLGNVKLGKPIVQANTLGMTWICDLELRESVPYKIHVIGPAFTDDFSVRNIEQKLDERNLSVRVKSEFMDFINQLPVISTVRFYEYGLMLHYCLSGEKIGISDFSYPEFTEKRVSEHTEKPKPVSHGTFLAEQRMLRFIQEGNLQYKKEMDKLISFGDIGKLADKDSLRQAKNSVIVFVTLCSRAAIAGGLPPEIALSLSDRYIQSAESSESVSSLTEISRAMRDDYIHRVFKLKTDSGISPKMRQACDYISLHPEGKLDIHALAQRLGYSDYYFTKKFKREVGTTVNEFAMKQRIQRAKELLNEKNLSVSDVSERLGFSSPSHFGDMFRKATGQSPGGYRNEL